MKKSLFTLLIIALMAPAFTQEMIPDLKPITVPTHVSKKSPSFQTAFPQNGMQSILEEAEWIDTTVTAKATYVSMSNDLPFKNRYDRHTQGTIYDMIHLHDDGFIGAAWTASEEPISDLNKRDIIYTCSKDGGKTWETEWPVVGNHAYWPCYAQWGANGEIIVCRVGDEAISGHDGLYIYRRETKGEGDWDVVIIPNFTEPANKGAVWQRICVTGENNEYLHVIMGIFVEGRNDPIVYNRSSDGGDTWDFEWTLLENLAGSDWTHSEVNLNEGYKWAKPWGDHIAFVVGRLGDDLRILKSTNHGALDSWKEILVWDCDFESHVDSGYRAMTGAHVAFDNNGKLHAVANAILAQYAGDDSFNYWPWAPFSTLVYWNEDRGTYEYEEMNQRLRDWAYNEFYYLFYGDDGLLYGDIGSITGKFDEFVVGGPVSLTDPEGEINEDDGKRYYSYQWISEEMGDIALDNYNRQGVWAFPQIIFDDANRLHLTYLGLVDGGQDGNGVQRRHVFHTSTLDEFKTFSPHTTTNDFLAIKNNEFSYPCLAGFYDNRNLLYMAQVDPLVGTFANGTTIATDNTMYAFNIGITKTNPVQIDAESTVQMNVYPNPATSSVKVDFVGKCNIELYNMVGQKVYQVENVTDSHQISLENLASGVYFITLRDGKKTATQKLIVQ